MRFNEWKQHKNTSFATLVYRFVNMQYYAHARTHASQRYTQRKNEKKHLARSHGFVECTKITNTLCECDVKIKIARLLLSPTGR